MKVFNKSLQVFSSNSVKKSFCVQNETIKQSHISLCNLGLDKLQEIRPWKNDKSFQRLGNIDELLSKKSQPRVNLSACGSDERVLSNQYFKNSIDKMYSKTLSQLLKSEQETLDSICKYIFLEKGKQMRPKLGLLIWLMLNLEKGQIIDSKIESNESFVKSQTWVALNEVLHNSSLLQDDILDEAELRRKRKTAHLVYGRWETAQTPIFMVGRAGRMIYTMGIPELYQFYSNIIIDLTTGEQIQSMIKKQLSKDSIEELYRMYLLKTYYKTASLFSNQFKGVGIISNNGLSSSDDELLLEFGLHIGIAFQIVDDILDFNKSSEDLRKTSQNDLKQGVLTSPVFITLMCLKEAQKDDIEYKKAFGNVLDIATKRDKSDENIYYVRDWILRTKSLEYSQTLANFHFEESLKILDQLGEFHNSDPYIISAIKEYASKQVYRDF